MSIITAPWTEREVALLGDFQALDDVHHYTCPVHSRLRLIPTRKGWRCADRDCNYDDEELSLRAASVLSGLCVFAAKPQAAVS